jgi:hypothetical protein
VFLCDTKWLLEHELTWISGFEVWICLLSTSCMTQQTNEVKGLPFSEVRKLLIDICLGLSELTSALRNICTYTGQHKPKKNRRLTSLSVWDLNSRSLCLSDRRHYPLQTVAAVETSPIPEVMCHHMWMSWYERSSNNISVKNINISVRPETCKYDAREWTARISIIDRRTWGEKWGMMKYRLTINYLSHFKLT